ncbi:protein SUPPRESSOR OF FRI 4 [Iris pallida]|uniref:Protein SUPPRESSOR OF FRI 4 n=1 Tax=Iris pallida TaxID=29817 RepID=A0AAX6IA63_IRIPA|nr:protein SUPPRESSOR OF FRI 4 [Iris pallida]KAJ6849315.1 protein SUPPRESSOR OF FRI 4 [Iris pallida]
MVLGSGAPNISSHMYASGPNTGPLQLDLHLSSPTKPRRVLSQPPMRRKEECLWGNIRCMMQLAR